MMKMEGIILSQNIHFTKSKKKFNCPVIQQGKASENVPFNEEIVKLRSL